LRNPSQFGKISKEIPTAQITIKNPVEKKASQFCGHDPFTTG